MAELDGETYSSLEALGICTVDAGGEQNIADVAAMYAELGKRVVAVCDKQSVDNRRAIEDAVEQLFMHDKASMEKLVLTESDAAAFERFAAFVDWPSHITDNVDLDEELLTAFRKYFNWTKGNWGIADFLAQCEEDEMPEWIRETCASLKVLFDDLEETDDGDTEDLAADAPDE